MKLSSSYVRQRAQQAGDQVEGVERSAHLTHVIAPPHRETGTWDAAEAGCLYPKVRQTAPRPPREPPADRTLARRVLVVGDQQDVVEYWTFVLGGAGHRVRGTGTEPEALVLAAAFRPDAAVLDFGTSNSAVARQLRRVPGLQGAVVIALGERGTEQDRRGSRAAGCDYQLTKPVDAAVLLQLLARPVEPL